VSAHRLGEPGVDGASERVAALGLLASAIASRHLRVSPGQPGGLAWTDGRSIFVDADANARAQIEAIAVQASLLAAGSLTPDVVRRLRRPVLARRYLAIEGHRALAAAGGILPRVLRRMIDPDLATRADSPAASLAAARSRETIADPPDRFGTIRTRQLLASLERAERSPAKRTHAAREAVLAELDDDVEGAGTDAFSSPAGGGALGRLLARMLRPVRQLRGGGPPGADAPTHRAQAATRADRAAVVSTPAAEIPAEATGRKSGARYPEWDAHQRRYRPDWCTVHETTARPTDARPFAIADRYGLRRPLARLGMGLDSCHRQAQGDDIDIDAAVEARVAAMAGSPPDEAVYLDSLRIRRDLAVLLLLDASGSTAEPAASGETVHEQQRSVAAALAAALHEIGDRVALYAFHSRGRAAVHLVPVKRFEDDLDVSVARRLGGLVPGAYSRLGAAIRHGAAVLADRGGTSRRLLVVLSDGLAYDHGYEPAYGAADARRALAEARSRGVGCLGLTIGAGTDAEILQRVFGSAAHATIPTPGELRRVIRPLFRSALRSAEIRRRRSR
jgi:hypothetical protein